MGAQDLRHLALQRRKPIIVGQIGLRQHHRAAADAEQIEDERMLVCLRLGTLVAGHDEQREINSARAGHHVANEPLVPRNVDERQACQVRVSFIRKPEIDGDSSRLLFFQPIRVYAGQRFDERRLAVVDMAGRADDHSGPGVKPSGLTPANPAASVS